ncbi:MAG: hypothetical protein K2P81_01560 [Bacteriovoracaceae bacterium]|nr:hypothetical protein [Bacteriovoracaceae bacterium]
MTHFMARTFLFLASPFLMVLYWRNNIKKIDLEELRMMVSYNDLGSFFPER